MKIKTIDINALEWWDKVNGNHYFAGEVIINYQMKGEKRFIMPFQYGYGEHYIDMAGQLLVKQGLIPDKKPYGALKDYVWRNSVILRANKQPNCLLRELKHFKEVKE